MTTITTKYLKCGIIAMLTVIILAGSIGAGIGVVKVRASAAAISNGNEDKAVCLNGDARYSAYWNGYIDGVNDFNHIKHYPVVPMGTLNATEVYDYHSGYNVGWFDAKVNRTSIDKTCFDDNIPP